MKCHRCGVEEGIIKAIDIVIVGEDLAKRIILCEKCIDEFLEFIEGKKFCKCGNKAYITTMYEDVWE